MRTIDEDENLNDDEQLKNDGSEDENSNEEAESDSESIDNSESNEESEANGRTSERNPTQDAAKIAENVKKIMDAAKNGAKVTEKAAQSSQAMRKIAGFIAKLMPAIGYVAVVILILIWLIGMIAFFQTMPAMMIGKLKEFCNSIWTNFIEKLDSDMEHYVSDDDVQQLAQYITDMGYDVQSYGFGDIEYDTNGKVVDSTHADNDEAKVKDKYLKAYLAADEATYHFSRTSLISIMTSWVKTKNTTGLIKVVNSEAKSNLEIVRDDKVLRVYTKALDLPIVGWFKDLFTGKRAFQWGDIFSYDLDTWLGRYTRPTELFLSLHLSTMMPDLTYQIATSKDFNTKVNVYFQKTEMKIQGNALKSNITLNGVEYSGKEIIEAYLRNSVYAVTTKYYITNADREEEEVDQRTAQNYYSNNHTAAREKTIRDDEKTNKFYEAVQNVNDDEGAEELGEVFIKVMEKLDPNTPGFLKSEQITVQINGSDYVLQYNNNQSGITASGKKLNYEEAFGLATLFYKFLKGVDGVYWPFITTVDNHWYYSKVDFTKNSYRLAKAGKKTLNYSKEDSKGNVMSISIPVEIRAQNQWPGIVYQVNEPEVEAPNDNIVKLFIGDDAEYYRYDGTVGTAQRIANARARDEKKVGLTDENATVQYYFNGESYDSEALPDGFGKEKVSFDENSAAALEALAIVDQMHTVSSDYIYRDLKQLLVDLKYYDAEDLTEVLKLILLWPIEVTQKNETFELTNDINEFGTTIVVSNGRTILSPCDGTIISAKNDELHIKIDTLNDETKELLEYIYEDDFKKVDPEVLNGIELIIKGGNYTKTSGKVKRGDKIGTTTGNITILMKQEDDSVIDNIDAYMREDKNNKYEEIMREKMKNSEEKEGIDITKLIKTGVATTSSSTNSSAAMGSGAVIQGTDQTETIWLTLTGVYGYSEEAAAAIMGNLYAESGCISNNLQNSYNVSLGYSDEEYTSAVDSGAYSKNSFVHDEAGYGLAQWTFWSRKQNLYEACENKGVSISDIGVQLAFLDYELRNGYTTVYNDLTNDDKTIYEKTVSMMTNFEKPANQSDPAKMERAKKSEAFYDMYHGTTASSSEEETTSTREKMTT